jgi:hypothetical protein
VYPVTQRRTDTGTNDVGSEPLGALGQPVQAVFPGTIGTGSGGTGALLGAPEAGAVGAGAADAGREVAGAAPPAGALTVPHATAASVTSATPGITASGAVGRILVRRPNMDASFLSQGLDARWRSPGCAALLDFALSLRTTVTSVTMLGSPRE